MGEGLLITSGVGSSRCV